MTRRTLVIAALLAVLALPAHAQWPDRPVKLLLSQPAGSGPDSVARLLADHMARTLGKPVVIDNRPGGQNIIGATAAARLPADGYNFYLGTLGSGADIFKVNVRSKQVVRLTHQESTPNSGDEAFVKSAVDANAPVGRGVLRCRRRSTGGTCRSSSCAAEAACACRFVRRAWRC